MRARLVTISLLLTLAHAQAYAQDGPEWYRPTSGDLELGLAGNFGHLFNSELTALDLQLNLGYFFTDYLEGGVAISIGYFGTPTKGESTTRGLRKGLGMRRQALASGPIAQGRDWYGGTELWLRLFPFVAFTEDLLPEFLAPYVHLESGALYARDVSPFFSAAIALGLSIYITNQIALSTEVGYGIVYASDDAASFGDSSVEHTLAVNFGLSVFFTP